jgi:hypothetical protein
MATFIEIQTDAFAKNLGNIKKEGIKYEGVRRPFRGVEIKEDTYAVIKVVKSNGDEIPLVDAGGPDSPTQSTRRGTLINPYTNHTTTHNYSNFIIQQVQDSRQEKQQILETFGDSYIFFFGERPRVLSVSGLLINTLDFNWRTEFWHNYEHVLRGTKLVEQDARIYLHWDDIIVEGYMIEAMARDDASSPYHVAFSFQLFVTNHMYLSTVGDDNYPITHAVNLDATLRQDDAEEARTDLKARSRKTAKYESNIEKVRKELEASEQARVASQERGLTGIMNSSGGQKFMKGKNLLANALAVGINAQNLTFLSVVNTLFRARKMRFPKGIGGMFSYSGPPQYAGEPAAFATGPKRSLPFRSKIRDNTDEYIGTADDPEFLPDYLLYDSESITLYDLEKAVLNDLRLAGIDPVQHPGGSPFKDDHSLGVFAGSMSEAALLAIGFSVSGVLAGVGEQGLGGLILP